MLAYSNKAAKEKRHLHPSKRIKISNISKLDLIDRIKSPLKAEAFSANASDRESVLNSSDQDLD